MNKKSWRGKGMRERQLNGTEKNTEENREEQSILEMINEYYSRNE